MTTAQNIQKKQRGFTLIELMIVIVIIAVLATIGITVYSSIQSGARNSARREDIDSLAKALETNRTPAGYQPLAATQFAGGAIPSADVAGTVYAYVTPGTTATPGTVWTTTAPTGYTAISSAVPAANAQSWKICTWLEAQGTTAAVAYCRTNQQ